MPATRSTASRRRRREQTLECARRNSNPATCVARGRDAGVTACRTQVRGVRFVPALRFPFRLVNDRSLPGPGLPGAGGSRRRLGRLGAGRRPLPSGAHRACAPMAPMAATPSAIFIMRDAAFRRARLRHDHLRSTGRAFASRPRCSIPKTPTAGLFLPWRAPVIRENAGDLAQSAAAGFEYFNVLNNRFGHEVVDRRVYVSASTTTAARRRCHRRCRSADRLRHARPVDRWARRGEAPADSVEQVLRSVATASPRPAGRCRYPDYRALRARRPEAGRRNYQCWPANNRHNRRRLVGDGDERHGARPFRDVGAREIDAPLAKLGDSRTRFQPASGSWHAGGRGRATTSYAKLPLPAGPAGQVGQCRGLHRPWPPARAASLAKVLSRVQLAATPPPVRGERPSGLAAPSWCGFAQIRREPRRVLRGSVPVRAGCA